MKTNHWKGISVALIAFALIALVVVNLGWAKGLSSIQTENAQLKGQIAVLENQNQELRDELLEKSKEIDQLKNKISLLENQNRELLEKSKVSEDRIAKLQEEIERCREKQGKQEKQGEQIKTVKLEPPLVILTGENRVDGFHHPFYDELHVRVYTSGIAGIRLIQGLENFALQGPWRTLIFVIPPSAGGIEEYREVEQKYPNLTPISSAQIERFIQKYGVPFLYLVRDSNNRIIGVIVANSVDANLARLMVEKIVLDTPFRYKGGKIKILES